MSKTGQAKLRASLPDLAENAKIMTTAQLARHYGVGRKAVTHHLKRVGIVARKHQPASVTVDEAELRNLAQTMHQAALARHFDRSEKIIHYRLKALGIKAAPSPSSKGGSHEGTLDKYADLADRAKEMHTAALARHYDVTGPTIYKALQKRGLKAIEASRAVFMTPHKRKAPHVTPFTERRSKSLADMAAEFLQRFSAVYRCDENGRANPKGEFYRRGRAVLTPAEIIERAHTKGWCSDDWKMVA